MVIPNEDIIRKTLSEADISGIDALIIYDPSGEVSKYHFMAIGKTKQLAEAAKQKIYDLGYGGGGTYEGRTLYEGFNGLYGLSHYIIQDFREKIRDNPKQEGILFIPLEGITPVNPNENIDFQLLIKCVEFARFN